MNAADVFGEDLTGRTLWHGRQITTYAFGEERNSWISTSRDHMLVTHSSLEDLVQFHLQYAPGTEQIKRGSSYVMMAAVDSKVRLATIMNGLNA